MRRQSRNATVFRFETVYGRSSSELGLYRPWTGRIQSPRSCAALAIVALSLGRGCFDSKQPVFVLITAGCLLQSEIRFAKMKPSPCPRSPRAVQLLTACFDSKQRYAFGRLWIAALRSKSAESVNVSNRNANPDRACTVPCFESKHDARPLACACRFESKQRVSLPVDDAVFRIETCAQHQSYGSCVSNRNRPERTLLPAERFDSKQVGYPAVDGTVFRIETGRPTQQLPEPCFESKHD